MRVDPVSVARKLGLAYTQREWWQWQSNWPVYGRLGQATVEITYDPGGKVEADSFLRGWVKAILGSDYGSPRKYELKVASPWPFDFDVGVGDGPPKTATTIGLMDGSQVAISGRPSQALDQWLSEDRQRRIRVLFALADSVAPSSVKIRNGVITVCFGELVTEDSTVSLVRQMVKIIESLVQLPLVTETTSPQSLADKSAPRLASSESSPSTRPPTIHEPTPTITRLIVTRTAETGGRPYTVLLDDKPIGTISPGATQRFEIPTGMHWVTAKTRKEQSNNQVIEPHEGDQITLTCGPAAGDQIDDLGRRLEGIILEMVG